MPTRQPARWMFRFRNPASGHVGLPPIWLLVLRGLVFFQGTTQVHRTIEPFLRVWQPRAGECWAWAYKVWTGNVFREKALETGLELTFGPSPGDAPIAGRSPAQRGLTDGHHGTEVLVTVYEYHGEPYIVRYEYPEGFYWEVFHPSEYCCDSFALKPLSIARGRSLWYVAKMHVHLQVGTPMRKPQPIPHWHLTEREENPVESCYTLQSCCGNTIVH